LLSLPVADLIQQRSAHQTAGVDFASVWCVDLFMTPKFRFFRPSVLLALGLIVPFTLGSALAETDKKPEKKKGEISLFDGKTLGKWEPIRFGGEGEVHVTDKGNMYLPQGALMTGVRWKGEVPATTDYEFEMEAMKIFGDDFMLALTLPVNDTYFSFVCGGWGGGVVGISSIDGLDASENETATFSYFEPKRWYKFRVRVESDLIQCWITDDEGMEEKMVDVDIEGAKIGLRPGDIELCIPMGMATYVTEAQYRNMVWRPLPKEEDE